MATSSLMPAITLRASSRNQLRPIIQPPMGRRSFMHVFGAFELDIKPGTPDTRHPSGLRSCAMPGARTDACSSLRSAPRLRR
jgi:hypothetical protein